MDSLRTPRERFCPICGCISFASKALPPNKGPSLTKKGIVTEKTANRETDDTRSSDTPESNKRPDDLAKNAREGLQMMSSKVDPLSLPRLSERPPTTMRAETPPSNKRAETFEDPFLFV